MFQFRIVPVGNLPTQVPDRSRAQFAHRIDYAASFCNCSITLAIVPVGNFSTGSIVQLAFDPAMQEMPMAQGFPPLSAHNLSAAPKPL
jgi:hypothetical protein